ncbi:hypothetical protein IscW_ISCW002150 [Ixodes scapularis]|uniref:Uncharacterized protein n=1 Tax=Ixodes scapularis TaxID=6945 RepID=B7P8J0_IXOSC|nr:hypothetical protein IscW_ISCW002150 [Ixodes scapularis]|eukprot:XP_002402148.1 hypothetical protein IscW_ISCW002150 [Ixodes scapularis]
MWLQIERPCTTHWWKVLTMTQNYMDDFTDMRGVAEVFNLPLAQGTALSHTRQPPGFQKVVPVRWLWRHSKERPAQNFFQAVAARRVPQDAGVQTPEALVPG